MTTSLRTESSQPERLLARATPLGSGVIEFDPNAVSRTEARTVQSGRAQVGQNETGRLESGRLQVGPVERAVSVVAFIGLLIAMIYLVYQFVSQHFEPMLYVITHF